MAQDSRRRLNIASDVPPRGRKITPRWCQVPSESPKCPPSGSMNPSKWSSKPPKHLKGNNVVLQFSNFPFR
eukprot:1889018-Pyramimonas_sp.AAC.1